MRVDLVVHTESLQVRELFHFADRFHKVIRHCADCQCECLSSCLSTRHVLKDMAKLSLAKVTVADDSLRETRQETRGLRWIESPNARRPSRTFLTQSMQYCQAAHAAPRAPPGRARRQYDTSTKGPRDPTDGSARSSRPLRDALASARARLRRHRVPTTDGRRPNRACGIRTRPPRRARRRTKRPRKHPETPPMASRAPPAPSTTRLPRPERGSNVTGSRRPTKDAQIGHAAHATSAPRARPPGVRNVQESTQRPH